MTKVDDVTEIAVFLVFLEHHDPLAIWGGRRIKKVVDAFARIAGVDPSYLRARLLESFEGDDD